MNKTVKALIVGGAIIAAAVPAVAYARNVALKGITVVAAETAAVEVQPTESVIEQTTTISETTEKAPEIKITSMPVKTLTEIQDSEQKAETQETTKKATKKAAKKAKKTVKKTKKVTKKAKKTKKTTKKTAAKKLFTYGNSKYVNGNITVSVKITKDNKAKVEVSNRRTDKDKISHCEFFTFTGTINKKTGVLSYSDCTKRNIVSANSGNNIRTHYTDGKGTLKFCGNRIIWTDNNSKDYQSVKLTKA